MLFKPETKQTLFYSSFCPVVRSSSNAGSMLEIKQAYVYSIIVSRVDSTSGYNGFYEFLMQNLCFPAIKPLNVYGAMMKNYSSMSRGILMQMFF